MIDYAYGTVFNGFSKKVQKQILQETYVMKIKNVIHIYGASGSGTSTLGSYHPKHSFSGKQESEIEKVILRDELPENWTYPLIQPKLIEKYLQIEKQAYSQIQLASEG